VKSQLAKDLGEIVKKKVKEQPLDRTFFQLCCVGAAAGQFCAMRQGQPAYYLSMLPGLGGSNPSSDGINADEILNYLGQPARQAGSSKTTILQWLKDNVAPFSVAEGWL
jgi:hypothetical protein